MASSALKSMRIPLARGTFLMMGGSQGAQSFKRGAPLIVRQFAANANMGGKGAMQSNLAIYVGLAAVGAGGGYFWYSQPGSVDYKKVNRGVF